MNHSVIHLVGFLVAVALSAMLVAMVLQDRVRRGVAVRRDGLPLLTGVLSLAWSAGSLALYGASPVPEAPAWRAAVMVLAHAALGFLPAVFVQSVLGAQGGHLARTLRASAYGLGVAAASLHAANALRFGEPSSLGLQSTGFGFLVLVPPVLVAVHGGVHRQPALVWATALAAFAVSALHLSGHSAAEDTWSSAFFGHHMTIPLVLATLHADYRFALVDLFLKRTLALLLLVGVVLVGHRLGRGQDPSALLVLWILTALAYPSLQRGVAWFVDRLVLRRPDYADLRQALASALALRERPEEVLDAVCGTVSRAFDCAPVRWSLGRPTVPLATVRVPTTEAPEYWLQVDELPGGRRLLSDDLAFLDAAAGLAARRIDAVRLVHERCQRTLREEAVAKLATEAELRALQAQLNPHFLFNALNTLGYLMQKAPARATATLRELTHLLRAVLKRSGGGLTTLGQEMELVESYLAIEQARFEERLVIAIDVPLILRAHAIPPLVLQPLVENAIKHGIARRRDGGCVSVSAVWDGSGADGPALVLAVADDGEGAWPAAVEAGRRQGLGLSNLERRLEAHYGGRATFQMASAPERGTKVTLRLPLTATHEIVEPSGRDAFVAGPRA